jgi:hypothetical protein
LFPISHGAFLPYIASSLPQADAKAVDRVLSIVRSKMARIHTAAMASAAKRRVVTIIGTIQVRAGAIEASLAPSRGFAPRQCWHLLRGAIDALRFARSVIVVSHPMPGEIGPGEDRANWADQTLCGLLQAMGRR